MKQLTDNLLQMNFHGVDWDKVAKIEFAFSQKIGGFIVKESVYPGDVIGIDKNIVGVPWEKADPGHYIRPYPPGTQQGQPAFTA